jgi:hypothetical protein
MLRKDNETHPFIDLPDLELPIKWEDVFDDQDIDIADGSYHVDKPTATTSFMWLPQLIKSGDSELPYLLAVPNGNRVGRTLYEWFQDTFQSNFLASPQRGLGKVHFPITLIKFHGTTLWHREGHPYWADDQMREYLNNRSNFAFNFPFYGEKEETSVQFAKGSIDLENLSKKLLSEHKQKHNLLQQTDAEGLEPITLEHNILTASHGDFLLSKEHADSLNVVGEKVKYDCGYIIPLSSWHKVHANSGNRLSLRFMGNNDYTFSDICHMYDNNKLLK